MRKTVLLFIKIYQNAISTLIGGRAACRFIPTCSEYTRMAIEKYGVWRGTWMGLKRISRCRPGGGFGYDPVP
jgi:putative membrane protein insertion efficiency factor